MLTAEDSYSHMESGSCTDDDYETYLYSLIHHSGGNQLEEKELLPGSLSSERMSVEQSGSSEVITPFYHSKRSKASRWDMVKILTGASDLQPCNGRTVTLSSDTKNKIVIKPGQKKEIQNNFSSLLHAYNEGGSSGIQSAPAKELNFQKTYAEYSYRGKNQKENAFSNAVNVGSKNGTHTGNPFVRESPVHGRIAVAASNSFLQDSVFPSAAENYHPSVPRSTSAYLNNSSDNGHFNNYTYSENRRSQSQDSCHENMLNDGVGADGYKNRKCSLRNKMRGNRHEQLKSEMSKYDLSLNKDKQNSADESVIILDSSDSDNDSVVEVEPPVRDPPPVVSLSSDEEALNNMSDEKRLKNELVEDDIVVLYASGKSSASVVSSAVTDSNIHNESMDSVGSCATVVLNGKSTAREDSGNKRRKRKKKKHKEGEENGRCKKRSLNSVFEASPSTSSFISPNSWSKDMSHFYNDSWGGENFDVRQLQKSMSDDPANWWVLYNDIVSTSRRTGPDHRKKCINCNIWGHTAASCPDPRKPIVCLFCGKTGHSKHRCPTAICLRCGRSALAYRDGCSKCTSSKKSYKTCSVCNNVGHPSSECPETWRRYHATTTSKDLSAVSPRILYKPQEEQFCSNCARRGHLYHECRSAGRSSVPSCNLLKRRCPLEHNRKPAKRRKHNNHSAELSSFNLYFQPCYYPI